MFTVTAAQLELETGSFQLSDVCIQVHFIQNPNLNVVSVNFIYNCEANDHIGPCTEFLDHREAASVHMQQLYGTLKNTGTFILCEEHRTAAGH